jgi:hypothetical protein
LISKNAVFFFGLSPPDRSDFLFFSLKCVSCFECPLPLTVVKKRDGLNQLSAFKTLAQSPFERFQLPRYPNRRIPKAVSENKRCSLKCGWLQFFSCQFPLFLYIYHATLRDGIVYPLRRACPKQLVTCSKKSPCIGKRRAFPPFNPKCFSMVFTGTPLDGSHGYCAFNL